jgi:hypothetical protein
LFQLKWNQPIPVEWNNYISFHFVPEPNTPLEHLRNFGKYEFRSAHIGYLRAETSWRGTDPAAAHPRAHRISANNADRREREKVYLSGILANTTRACSPHASGVAAAAALIAAGDPFFIGLFNAKTFVVGFLACCLGIGSIFAAGRTGGVDGTPATGPTAAATGPGE